MTTSWLPVVSLIALLIASVLHIVAFSTDHWLHYTNEMLVGTFDYHLGLWSTCYRNADMAIVEAGNETVTTVTITPWLCTNTHAWLAIFNNGKYFLY